MTSRVACTTACLALTACLGNPPLTHVSELDPVCEGTEPDRACITLVPSATDAVLDELGTDGREGALAWALYEDGDVGALGPDDRDGYEIAGEHVIDLWEDPQAGAVTIVDFDPGWFQVLAYFRPLPVEEPGEGDALTLPTSGFEAPANVHTTVEVVLDHVR